MKKSLLCNMLFSSFYLASFATFAGDIDVVSAPEILIGIPDMSPGWEFNIVGSALRPYNNNLNYSVEILNDFFSITSSPSFSNFHDITPNYGLDLMVGAGYTLPNSANIIKVLYEHYFDRKSTANYHTPEELSTPANFYHVSANLREKFDGVSVFSEQHLLIGPVWEAYASGGFRFAHLEQLFSVANLTNQQLSPSLFFSDVESLDFSMQFNGVGPMLGFGSLFHISNSFALGANLQSALLLGKNKLNQPEYNSFLEIASRIAINSITKTTGVIPDIYSLVPEITYRLYANYFYTFNNESELEIEAGWRANHFFNLRTFDNFQSAITNSPYNATSSLDNNVALNMTTSDNISFSGPYLSVKYKL